MKVEKTEKAMILVYCVALSQLLIYAIDKAEENRLFRYDVKQIANRFRTILEKKIHELYGFHTDNKITEEAELEFYDFVNLLEMELQLIMEMNNEERKELITLLDKVKKRLDYEK
jgi:hypothetical protein